MKAKMVKTRIIRASAMREARRRLGITQFDLAQRAGCSEAQVSKIETGRMLPEDWLREAIARELGIKTWEVGA
jgi:ribosome-binding protein aMBF1 (putative translation factor)